jgi:hypothetical protein
MLACCGLISGSNTYLGINIRFFTSFFTLNILRIIIINFMRNNYCELDSSRALRISLGLQVQIIQVYCSIIQEPSIMSKKVKRK